MSDEILTAFENKIGGLSIISNDASARFKKESEEKAAEKKRFEEKIKSAQKLVKERTELRKGVYSYRKSTEPQNETTFASKISRLNDLNPEALVGEYLAIFSIQFFEGLFQTQYWIQQRAFSEAIDIDTNKELRIKRGQATDDGVRVAYQPKREWNDKTEEFEYVLDKHDNLIYPEVYEVNEAGNVDYHSKPNTNGTASRAAIRANGFVPIEDWKESVGIQLLKFQEEFIGTVGMTPDQKRKLNKFVEQHIEEAQRNGNKDVEDTSVINANAQRAAAAAAAARQQDAARKSGPTTR